ncbi:MAG: PQQ-binding-like beta-propeller repeat protein [Thermoplasmatales archaeon]|nr:PQQ-binding-like beta-propeller repeat protein [Thermoplasmatales archaeon]
MKHIIPILIVLLLLSSGFVGVSNTTEELTVDTEQMEQTTATSAGPMNSSWPMFGHDVRHTGRSPYSTANNEYILKWTYWVDFGIDSSPAIDENNIIYVSSKDNYLHALYPNGTEKWRFDCHDWVTSSPAIDEDGVVYVGSWADRLFAINPNGSLKWRFDTHDTITSSPTIAKDGTIYFGVLGAGSNKGLVYALNPNGTVKWHFDTGDRVYFSPAIGDDGTVYVTSNSMLLYALYPNNGTMKWSRSMGAWCGSPTIADDGTIYVATMAGDLKAIYPNNGTIKWTSGIDWGSANTPSIAEDGTIYIGQKYFYAINPDGTRKWTFDPEGDLHVTTSSAISADGTIYFGVTRGIYRGDIIALNPDGTEKWQKVIADDWVYSSPVIDSEGTVYIGSQSRVSGISYGYLYAFGEVDSNAPDAPDIDGRTNGRVRRSYDYTFMSTDPNGDDVYYYIEWGDGAVEDWLGPYSSGEEITLSHTWNEKGTYTIRARAKDTYNLWGPWGELEVTMPMNQQSQNWWFLQFLQNHPRMFPILRQLLGLHY